MWYQESIWPLRFRPEFIPDPLCKDYCVHLSKQEKAKVNINWSSIRVKIHMPQLMMSPFNGKLKHHVSDEEVFAILVKWHQQKAHKLSYKLGLSFFFQTQQAPKTSYLLCYMPTKGRRGKINHTEASGHLRAKTCGCKPRNFVDTFMGTREVGPMLGWDYTGHGI